MGATHGMDLSRLLIQGRRRWFFLGYAILASVVIAYAAPPRAGVVSLTTTAAKVGQKDQRAALTVCNEDTTNRIRCGPSTVTSSAGGIGIAAGSCWTVDQNQGGANSALEDTWCVATSGTITASYWETVK